MSERPILFNDAMVQAILDGSKTHHRQPVVPQPRPYAGGVHPKNTKRHDAPYIDSYCSQPKTEANPRGMSDEWCWWTEDDRPGPFIGKCPFGKPGDRLWAADWAADACCYTPVVKRVWVERLQDISEADAVAEGFQRREHFIRAWDSIYAAKGYGFDANLWVWACEFEKERGAR